MLELPPAATMFPLMPQAELQMKLAEARLPKSGKKAELVQRLMDAFRPPPPEGQPSRGLDTSGARILGHTAVIIWAAIPWMKWGSEIGAQSCQ